MCSYLKRLLSKSLICLKSCVPIQRLHPSKTGFEGRLHHRCATEGCPNLKAPSSVSSFVSQAMKATTDGRFVADLPQNLLCASDDRMF